jgi:hypothetical protein
MKLENEVGYHPRRNDRLGNEFFCTDSQGQGGVPNLSDFMGSSDGNMMCLGDPSIGGRNAKTYQHYQTVNNAKT